MRVKRVDKFGNRRNEKIKNAVIFFFLLPLLVIAIGWIISSYVVVPAMLDLY